MKRAARLVVASWIAGVAIVATAAAADLQARTAEAYDKYAAAATQAFVARAQKMSADRRCNGVMTARAGSGDGILNVPDGLVHHWVASAFLRGATVREASDVARAYSTYSKVYESVLSSRVLSQQGDTYRVLIRLKEEHARISAVLDVRSAVEYRTLSDGPVVATSRSEEIREVHDAGKPTESLLPAGRDSGYLWRAHTFTYFKPEDDGVFVVMETLGLSRRFPRGFGWIIEPIARRLGRKSVEGSLLEFATAVQRAAGSRTAPTLCSV